MIQFNLLPDVKLEYLRAKRTKRLVMLTSSVITAVAVLIFALLLVTVFVFQRTHLNNLSKDITSKSKDLEDTPGLNQILTVQNQLFSLPAIHDTKPAITRLFPFIQKVTPANASISTLNVEYESTAITITGTADRLETINTFVDTLKFTNYKNGDTTTPAFSEVVLSSFGKANNKASFTITLKYDPEVFLNTNQIDLQVPQAVTTRSETEKPGETLFEKTTESEEQ